MVQKLYPGNWYWPKRRKKLEKKIGAPPGSLYHVGEESGEPPSWEIVDYTPEHVEEEVSKDIDGITPYKERESVTWINTIGLDRTERIGELGERFGLHPLLIEDVLNTDHRPKFEHHGDHLFLTLKMLELGEEGDITSEQISLVLGASYVLSFQERKGDVFDPIRTRLRNKKGLIRTLGPDYLFYALLDAVVDHYFLVIDHMDSHIENLDASIINDPESVEPHDIRALKKETVQLRKSIAPAREAVGTLLNSEAELISDRTSRYLRDVHDHTVAVVSSLETQRELSSDLLDSYMSLLSVRMNSIMKVLTIIASIFIPLTFIAGVYGMNFEHMPELTKPWAYPAALLLMLFTALAMIVYFRKKGWI
jgi:magnesium transporter